MTTFLVIADLLFRGIYECWFVILFHCVSKREAVVGTYVGCIKEVMNFVEGTVVQLIYFMEPVHYLLGKGCVLFGMVLRHNYAGR